MGTTGPCSHSEMSACPDARLKRRRDVPALWETALGTVLSNLSTEHTDQFVKSVLGDSVLRERFTEELLRRARHVPDLGDSDLMEFVRLCPAHERESREIVKYCKVGDLPYWLNAAIKTQFRKRCAHDARVSYLWGIGNITQDGRLQFDLLDDDAETLEPLTNAYFEHLEQIIAEEGIPSKEETRFAECDEVDMDDVAPHVEYDTCLWDAWWMKTIAGECALREDCDERLDWCPFPGFFRNNEWRTEKVSFF